jgi:S-formylglutathione hydrolase FrmB
LNCIGARQGIRASAVVGLVASFAVVVALASGAAQRSSGAPTAVASFRSRALGDTLHFSVSLPRNYSDGRRYPVVYFLHGLPAGPAAYRDVSLAQHALDELKREAILVVPQGASDRDSDPEYLDWGSGRNWETALARELPAYVDRHYRTIAGRRGRAITGLSAGGYGAMLIGLHNLGAFSVIESWSGYLQPTDPSGTHILDLGSSAANAHASAHSYVRVLRRAFRTKPTFIGFYVGTQDSRFRRDNVQLHDELAAARVPHLFRLYAGGHQRTLWSAHAREWLGLALARLATPASS